MTDYRDEVLSATKERVFEGQDPESLWPDEFLFRETISTGFTHTKDGVMTSLPNWPGDIGAAWELLQELVSRYHHDDVPVRIELYASGAANIECGVTHGVWDDPYEWNELDEDGSTLEIAICRAWLLAQEKDDA